MSAPHYLAGRVSKDTGAAAAIARPAPVPSLQEVIEGLPEEIAILDASGSVVCANRAWLRSEEPRGPGKLPHPGHSYLRLWEGLKSREAAAIASGIRAVIRGDRTRFTGQFRIRLPNRWSELSVTRIDVRRSFNLLVVHRDVTEAERTSRALRVLSRRLIRAQEAERRRIARELHDQTAQNLTAISLSLARIELASPPGDTTMPALLSESRELAERCVAQLRTLSYLLRPPLLDDEGLVSALRWYASGFQRRSGIRTEVRASGGFGRLPRDVELALFAVIQECLTNVYRHSTSERARIHLRRSATGVTVEVVGQGSRLSAEQRATARRSQGLGIRSMRERLDVVGGTFELRQTDAGVAATATVPLRWRRRPRPHGGR